MLFDSWAGLGRVLLVGPPAYVALVAILRISGKRTLTKLNAFDLVVTVALGSTLATVLLSKSVALAEGVLAMVLLVFLQFMITCSSACAYQALTAPRQRIQPAAVIHLSVLTRCRPLARKLVNGIQATEESNTRIILMSPRHRLHVSLALALLSTSPVWAQPASSCGDATRVSRADTLSGIAARCDTTEAAILRANPTVEGSDDLRVGRELKLTASTTQPTSERLGSLAREAGNALSGMAQDLTSSVDNLLDKNPDLRQRLGGIGDRINSASVDVSKAEISLAPGSGTVGTTVTVNARGLPADTAVVIGGGAPRTAYEVLQQAKTAADGTLQATVRIPDWSTGQERFVVTVAAEEAEWKVRSAPFQITGTKL